MKEMNRKNIFLIGFMGSGKSSVCSRLADILDMKCAEMDEMIVEKAGMPITDIFDTFGEEYFRNMETDVLMDLKETCDTVVSCGGGCVLRRYNSDIMKMSGIVVYLTAAPETIYERVKDEDSRPILNGNMNVGYISSLMDERRPLYESAADITIDTDLKTIDEICDEIIRRLSTYNDIS